MKMPVKPKRPLLQRIRLGRAVRYLKQRRAVLREATANAKRNQETADKSWGQYTKAREEHAHRLYPTTIREHMKSEGNLRTMGDSKESAKYYQERADHYSNLAKSIREGIPRDVEKARKMAGRNPNENLGARRKAKK